MSYQSRVLSLDDDGAGTINFHGGRYAGIRLAELSGAGTYDVEDYGGTIDSGTLTGPDYFHRLAPTAEVLVGGRIVVHAAHAETAVIYFRF